MNADQQAASTNQYRQYDRLDFSKCPNCGDPEWTMVQEARHDVSYWIEFEFDADGNLVSSVRSEFEPDEDGVHLGQFQCLSCQKFLPYQFDRFLRSMTTDPVDEFRETYVPVGEETL